MPSKNDNNKPPQKGGVVERLPQQPSTEVFDVEEIRPERLPTVPTKGK